MRCTYKFIHYGNRTAALKAAEEELFKEQLSRSRVKNRYRIWYSGKVVEMETHKKKPLRLGGTFFFDVEDLDKVLDAPVWRFNDNGYVHATVRNESKRLQLYLHRYLLDYYGPFEVDHRDRNPANNSRKNIWICTTKENQNNKSLYKNNTSGENGISEGFHNGKPKWRFTWRENGKSRHQYFERTDAGWDEAVKEKKKKYAQIGNKNGM